MPQTEKDRRDDATIKSLAALAYYEDDEPHKVRMTRAVELLKAQRDELVVLRDNLKAVAAELEKIRGKLAELLDESLA
jgi:hypothetical protein